MAAAASPHMFYCQVRLTGREGRWWRSQTGERVQVCLTPGDKWMREGDYWGAPHDTHSFRATPEWPTLPPVYPARWVRMTCGPHYTWSRLECRSKLDQILTKIWCNLPQRFTTVRNLMNFIWNTSSKTVLGRMKKIIFIHLSKTVLPQWQSRL